MLVESTYNIVRKEKTKESEKEENVVISTPHFLSA